MVRNSNRNDKGSIITRKDGGRPYRRMLSVKTLTAQKCIQELKTCNIMKEIKIQMDKLKHMEKQWSKMMIPAQIARNCHKT